MRQTTVHYETIFRSLIKSVTFRGLVLVSDFAISYLSTHRVNLSLEILLATNAASTLLYFLHERFWNSIQWKRTKNGKEHHSRSIMKAISFRITVILSDLSLATLVIMNLPTALGIITLTNTMSTLLYYIHERLWTKLTLGITKARDASII